MGLGPLVDHPAGGCAVDAEGEGLRVLRRTLAGYARHPNFAAVLVIGLGCETNQISNWSQQADMDINCGPIAEGEISVDAMGEQIFQSLLRVASGEKTKSELHGYGQNEFVPWQLGAVT